MASLASRVGSEPVLIMGAVQALIGVAVAFQLVDWTDAQIGAVQTAVAAVLSVIVRSAVTPVAKLKKQTTAQTRTELADKGLI